MKKNKLIFKKKNMIALLCAAVTLGTSLGALTGCAKRVKNVPIVISEVVSSNRYSLVASDGTSPDWIELYNPTNDDADLSGYGLSDDYENPYRFTFPEGTALKAGEYMVVYCTGSEDLAPEDSVYRAGFKLSSGGETVFLSGRNDQTLHLINLPALETDISVGLADDGETLVYYASPTPCAPNGGESNDTGVFEKVSSQTSLVINEFMSRNQYSIRTKDGQCYSWVEIKNIGSESVNLSEFGLSNDAENPNKWKFPDLSLEPGQIQLVYLSGLGTAANGEIHANFSLNTEDNILSLCDGAGNLVDYVTPLETDGSVSIGLYGTSLVYFAQSTPGAENTTEPYTDLTAAESYLPALYISELKASSEEDIDWIELYNAGEESADLSGWGLSDDLDQPYRYVFPDGTTLSAGGYLVVECKGGSGNYVTDFGLKKAGESVFLTNASGITVDHMNGGTQNISISRGRTSGDDNGVSYFATATKGAENSSDVFSTYAAQPQFSVLGGYVTSGTTVAITVNTDDTIYYTTDGSLPTTSSKQYTGPITISENTPLRARSYGSGKLASVVTTENYLVGEEHDIPVVCIAMDPEDFSGSAKGIYAKGAGYDVDDGQDYVHTNANYWQDWEREMNFEWFESDGVKGVSFDAGIKIFGQFSRELDQKSLSIKLRGEYGQSSVTYPFFRDHEYTTFYNLVLRQSGQDCGNTKIKDAMIAQVCKDTNVEVMEYRPCAVYINGKYWGLYNLREKQDADYVVTRYPEADKSTVNVLKGDFRYVNAGSSDSWRALMEYVKTHDMTQLDAQNYIEERVDLYSLYDWIAIEAFIANTDTGNKRRFNFDGAKWKWMLFDTDWALQASGSSSVNRLHALMVIEGHGANRAFTNRIARAIYANPKWRKEFVERYAELLNTTLRPERFTAIIDAMAAEIRSEMPRQIERWGAPESVEKWESNIDALKKTAEERWTASKKELQSTFGLSDARMQELFPND